MPSLLKGKSTFFTGAGLSPPGAPPHEKAVTFRGVVAFPRRYRFAGAPFLFWEVVIHAGGRCSSGRSSLMRAVVAHAGGHCSSGHRMPFRDVAGFRSAVTPPRNSRPAGRSSPFRQRRQYLRSRERYCTASAMWSASIFSERSRSAMVRATRRMRSCPRALSPSSS